jgi:hypothetical protein
MGFPKRVKYDNNVYKPKEGNERIEELMEMSDEKSTFLPKGITIEDIDKEVITTIKEGGLSFDIRGNVVPVIFMNDERWASFSKTWMLSDGDSNISTPFIVIKRSVPKRGTYLDTKYSTPNRKEYQYTKVPTFENGKLGYDIYKIPQPTPVDIDYNVKFFAKHIADVNTFVKTYLKSFTDSQYYINVNGHYFPMYSQENDQEDTVTDVKGDRYFAPSFSLLAKGYLQDPEDFTKEKAINRIFKSMEVGGSTSQMVESAPKVSISKNERVKYIIVYDRHDPKSPIKVMQGFTYTTALSRDGDPLPVQDTVGVIFDFHPRSVKENSIVISHKQSGTYGGITTENVEAVGVAVNGEEVSIPFTVVGGDTLSVAVETVDPYEIAIVDLEGKRI